MNRFDHLLPHLHAKGVFRGVAQAVEITSGGSGARLLDVTDGDGRYVVKTTFHSPYIHEERLRSYKREYDFYGLCRNDPVSFAPEIIHLEHHDDFGIVVVMKHYRPIRRDEWNMPRQLQAVDLCARLASLDVGRLSGMRVTFRDMEIDREFAGRSCAEWKSVVSRHGYRFDGKHIDRIFNNLDVICPILNARPHSVCHGDFHPNNILLDGEKMVLCDWQNVHIGKCAADFSFFLKRGFHFGMEKNKDALFEHYRDQLPRHAREATSLPVLLKDMHAATVHNSFLFWPYHLASADFERVQSIYDGMVHAFEEITG